LAHHQKDIKKLTPPNFCDSRYKTAKLDKNQWHWAFKRRSTVLNMISKGELDSALEQNQANLLDGMDTAIQAQYKPEAIKSVDKEKGFYEIDGKIYALTAVCTAAESVDEAEKEPVGDVDSFENLITQQKNIIIDDERQVVTLDDEGMKYELSLPIRTSNAFASVNLNTPDKILVEHFKLWLQEEREKAKERGILFGNRKNGSTKVMEITPAVMNNWHNNKILQYADVIQWNMLNDQKISDEDVDKIIFPGGDIDDKIRCTTRPQYKQFCEEEDLLHFHPLSD